jgi:amino acid adenylation domain-containing protein
LAAYAHQDVPFEKLLEELRPERDLSRSPLFQVFFNMVNVGDRRFDMYGLKVEEAPGDGIGSKFDLTIYAGERDNEIQLKLVYNSDLFNHKRMKELMQQYKQLLAQIAEQPERPISSYSLLTPAGAELLPDPVEKLSSDWMGSVHERFARQAESLPEHAAIADPRDTWSYRELNARSNRLAHYLSARGIQREDVVAIYGHRSAAIAWALLGVLKAGAAFLILDPGYPAARLSDYVKDAKPRGLVRLEAAGPIPDELEEWLKATVRCRIALPGQKALWTEDSLKEYSSADPGIPIGPDDLACISYTSGSTGGPKGILGRHGPLSHFLPWQASKFSLTSSDRFSMLSGLSHDPLQREIFTPLWIGASIHVPDPDAIGAPGRLSRWMADEKITFAHLTPAVGRLLTQGAEPDCRLSTLRHAFFVGDKLTRADVDSLRRLAPAVQCVNYYGSTETQRAVSYYEIPSMPVDGSQKAVLPVGRGMPDVQLLVLNKKSGLAGIGEVGEIHMRSPHLARGYLSDEDLTRARFVVNPFTGDRSDRLYKTGDLGRYLPDGNVEILGRNDGQIKLRGFRIEPAEIESVLTRHPDVREAVVTVYDNSLRDRELAGYVVLQQGAAPLADELRAFLKIGLPDYMVPSAFVFLDSLPLTPNGKVEYRALPDPQSQGARGRVEYVAARDETERVLCSIWSEALGVDRVGLDDNFFAIGGHSLLAAKLFARLDEAFGRSLPLSVLFRAPTVRLLAEHYRAGSQPGTHSAIVALTESGTLPPIFGVPGVFGDLICFADMARELGSAQPFYGLQAVGLDGTEVPLDSIEQMAIRYLNEIRQVQSHGPYALMGACFGATVAYEMARQLLDAGEKVAFLGLLDPTRREGHETNENPPAMPRVVKRAKSFGNFFTHRLRLYRKEMQGLDIGTRLRFVMQKIRSLGFTVGDRKAFTRVQREIYQRDVVRANIRALDGYQRKPLNGGLRAVEIFETSHPRNTTAWSFDWKNLWDGYPVQHRVSGKDSGDMLTGENGRVLALLLRERLKEAFAENGRNASLDDTMRAGQL